MSVSGYAQFMDRSNYLVDSLSGSSLSKADVIHIDSLVKTYHASASLEKKLDAIDKILESASNTILVDKYSRFLLDYTSKKLKEKNASVSDRKLLQKYKGIAYNYKGLYEGGTGNRSVAGKCYLKSLELFEASGFKVGIGYAYNNLGANYHRRGDLDSSLYYYRKGLEINQELNEKRGVASLQYNMAAILETQGRMVEAVALYHKAWKAFEEIKNAPGVAYTLNNLAAISFVLDDYDKAIEYQTRSMEAFKALDDDSGMSYCLNNMGAMYREKGDLDQAYILLQQSLEIRERIHMKAGIIDCLNNMSIIHSSRGENEIAYQLLLRAVRISRESKNKEQLANTLKNIGELDIEHGHWELAKKRLDSALRIGREIGSLEVVKESAKYRMKVASHHKNWKKAYRMQSLYIELRDSTRSDEARNAVILAEMRANHDKALLADSLNDAEQQRVEDLKNQQSIKQANLYTTFGIAGAVLMLLLALVLYFGYKRKKAGNIILAEKNEENQLLLGEIHHRVKNNLQVISSLLALQERNITDEKAKAAIVEGRERVQSIGLIHKHLYQNNHFSTVEMKSYVSHLMDGLIGTLGEKSKPVKLELNIEECHVDIDTAIPLGLMINELVVNALKYAFIDVAEPLLSVSMSENEEELKWEIADNGNGKKAEIEQSDSFGFKLIRSLTRQLGATFDIEEKEGLHFGITLKTKTA